MSVQHNELKPFVKHTLDRVFMLEKGRKQKRKNKTRTIIDWLLATGNQKLENIMFETQPNDAVSEKQGKTIITI